MFHNWWKLPTSDHFAEWKGVSIPYPSDEMIAMVDTVEISRVNIRDSLSLDVSVWMNHPNDMDFRPTLSQSQASPTGRRLQPSIWMKSKWKQSFEMKQQS
jgi:hypothetical protein